MVSSVRARRAQRGPTGLSDPQRRLLALACLVLSAALLGGAGAFLIFGRDKGLGIFLVLMAAVLSRVLVLNIAERLR